MAARSVLITGAAGNLGGLLARHLAGSGPELRLMFHQTPLAPDLLRATNVRAVRADLGTLETLRPAVENVQTVVHFAGVSSLPAPRAFRASYYGDTPRFRRELVPTLAYPSFEQGKATLG